MMLEPSDTPAQAGAHDVGSRAPTPAAMDPGLRRGDMELEGRL
jgi:hypothetical protein